VTQPSTRTRGVAVQVSRLVHIYRSDGHDVAALSGVDLSIDPGSTLALLGPSGAGKSTLLSLIAGMERPTAGTITIGSERTDQYTDAQRDALRGSKIGTVLQGGHRNLMPYLSVRENVRLAQWGAAGDTPDPDDLLDLVGLSADTARRRPADLRPSEAQLAALAVATSSGPGLLLADEPTASLGAQEAATDGSAHKVATGWSSRSWHPTARCPSPTTSSTTCHPAACCASPATSRPSDRG
jgi:putative ABC transport system ATP-binding protein